MQRLLIAYDISDNKARLRLAKLLDGYGSRFQKSVYTFELPKHAVIELVSKVRTMIFRMQSAKLHKYGNKLSVAIVPICKSCQEASLVLGDVIEAEKRVSVL